MIRVFFISAMGLILGLISCSKELADQDPEYNAEFSWTIGAEHSTDTLLNVPNSASGTAELSIEAYSICPTHQVQLTVSDDVDRMIFETIADTLATEIFPVLTDIKQLKIQAKLIEQRQPVNCVWLGQAKLVYRYVAVD